MKLELQAELLPRYPKLYRLPGERHVLAGKPEKRAREASQTTCESCGQPGTLRTDHYVRAHCDACEAEYQREQANPTERGWGDIDERIAKLKAMLDARSP